MVSKISCSLGLYNFRIRFERGEIVSPWSKVEKGWLKLPAAQDLVASKGEHEDSITFTWSNYLGSKIPPTIKLTNM